MANKPQIVHTEVVARTRVFTVEQVDLEFSNGTRVAFERLRGAATGAVLIVPMIDADQLLLIREYSVGSERYELGLPKGRVEAGEDLLEAANRELMEEVGYGARRLRLVKSLAMAPAYVSQTTHVILAQDLYAQRLPGDEPEPIEVVPWRLSRLDELLARDDCTEARSIAALYMVREIMKHDG